jgi:hypothetical protein
MRMPLRLRSTRGGGKPARLPDGGLRV